VRVPRAEEPFATLANAFMVTNMDDRPFGNKVCATTCGDLLELDGNFYLIETTSILANSITLVLLFVALRFWGIYVAAWLSVLRVMLQALFLMKILGPYHKMDLKTTSVRATWKKMQPPIAGNLYYKSDSLIDRYLTSTCVSGELTLFNLAQQLYSMCVSILNKVFVITLLPKLSEQANKEDWVAFQSLYRRRFYLLLIISLIFYAGVFIMGKPVLIFVFSLKNFAAADAVRLWSILILLFGFWFGGLLGNMTAGGFYTQGDTKTPTILSAILFTIYIPIKIFCFKQFGITGLSITISVYMLTSLIVQLIILEFIHRRKQVKY
jgi:peptidoglycan biosynthesis protein MviN/MurJ (putative lipid II flippase)